MTHPVKKETTIASGAALSSQTTGTYGTSHGGINMAGLTLVALDMPAVWTAADITFQESSDGVTYRNVFNADGTEFKITLPLANQKIPLADLDTAGWRFIKVRSGTAAAPVNQGAERIIGLIGRDLDAGG